MGTVLFSDPNAQRCALVIDHLKSLGFSVLVDERPDELSSLEDQLRSAAVAVIGMNAGNGARAEIIRSVRQTDPNIVLICGVGEDPEFEAQALEAGADEIVGRPYSPAQIEGVVKLGVELRRLRGEVGKLRALTDGRLSFEGLIGGSQPMVSLYRLLEQVAQSDAPALLQAEPGAEVEDVVASIHSRSDHGDGPLERLDAEVASAADIVGLAEGKGIGSHGAGTLWIRNVDRLNLDAQAALYRRLGGGGTLGAWRLVASTERDLMEMSDDGAFSRDLYYRINVFPVRIPSLRERIEDLPLLAADRLRRIGKGRGEGVHLSYRTLLAMSSHSWPGNVCELEEALKVAVERSGGGAIEPEALPREISSQAAAAAHATCERPLRNAKRDFEFEYIRNLLTMTHGNMSKASKISKVGRPYLYKKVREHGLNPEDFRWS